MTPLTSLDELIWKQFEKVTQYAHKNYGWDKYDLTNVMETAASGLMMGYGTYLVTAATMANSFSRGIGYAFLGTGTGLLGIIFGSLSRRRNENGRTKELQKLLQTGAASKPHYNALRPLALFGFTYVATWGLLSNQIKNENLNRVFDFAFITGELGFIFFTAASYFKDQIMTPPSAKKSFLKTLYQQAANRLKPKPALQPVEDPAGKYASVETYI